MTNEKIEIISRKSKEISNEIMMQSEIPRDHSISSVLSRDFIESLSQLGGHPPIVIEDDDENEFPRADHEIYCGDCAYRYATIKCLKIKDILNESFITFDFGTITPYHAINLTPAFCQFDAIPVRLIKWAQRFPSPETQQETKIRRLPSFLR